MLIGNDPAAADSIRAALAVAGRDSFDVEWVRQLSEGLERLSKKGIGAVLLELDLPDSQGIETFDKLLIAAPDVPILILGGNVPEDLAKQAVGRGAQDYLLPGHLDSYSLPRHRNTRTEGLPSKPVLCGGTRLPVQPACWRHRICRFT